MPEDPSQVARREFLFRSVAGVAAAAGAASRDSHARPVPDGPIPTIRLGTHTVTRLIAGGNPIGGWGHSVPNMSRHMLEYFTLERTVEFLGNCEREGINTWQFDHETKIIQALKIVRERGSKIQFICLHAEREKDAPLARVMADQNPIAIVHHGGVTDRLFREGKAGQVRDFVKKVRDLGVLAGVSSHNPGNIRRIADEGWENDLFMTCFYFVTRTAEEQRRLLGKVTVGEPFFEADPADMTEVIRQVNKPCLGFKILAAGRACDNQKSVAAAFQYAFQRIKPTDAVIVGMYPRFEDEVRLNAGYARTYGAVGT
jgi:hypothetical protein